MDTFSLHSHSLEYESFVVETTDIYPSLRTVTFPLENREKNRPQSQCRVSALCKEMFRGKESFLLSFEVHFYEAQPPPDASQFKRILAIEVNLNAFPIRRKS